MSSKKKKTESLQNDRGLIEAKLEPTDQKNLDTFSRFKSWCYEIFGRTNLDEDKGVELLNSAVDAQIHKQTKHRIDNEKIEAEIKFRLMQSRLSELELEKKSLFVEYEKALIEAKINKISAETESIRTESRIKALKALKELGVEVRPLIEGGQIKGLYLKGTNDTDK